MMYELVNLKFIIQNSKFKYMGLTGIDSMCKSV
jgi:hypothetical protein